MFVIEISLAQIRLWEVYLVCVTEQHYVSIFFTRLWSVGKPRLFDTENPEISGFQLRMRINTKPNCNQKLSEERIKMTFCWLITSLPMYQKSIDLPTDHKRVKKIETLCCSVTQTNKNHVNIYYILHHYR